MPGPRPSERQPGPSWPPASRSASRTGATRLAVRRTGLGAPEAWFVPSLCESRFSMALGIGMRRARDVPVFGSSVTQAARWPNPGAQPHPQPAAPRAFERHSEGCSARRAGGMMLELALPGGRQCFGFSHRFAATAESRATRPDSRSSSIFCSVRRASESASVPSSRSCRADPAPRRARRRRPPRRTLP